MSNVPNPSISKSFQSVWRRIQFRAQWRLLAVNLLPIIAGLTIWYGLTSIVGAEHRNLRPEVQPSPFHQPQSVSLVRIRKTFDIRSSDFQYKAYECFDHNNCSDDMDRRRIRQLAGYYKFGILGHFIEFNSRIWLIGEQRQAWVVYFEISQSR